MNDNYLLRWRPRAWAEDAVWALFTEVLRRLGPDRVDTSRLYVTGISLGANATWHMAVSYGNFFAAAVPISGSCEWPNNSWQGANPRREVLERLQSVPIRAYQIDIDVRSGHPSYDMEWLASASPMESRELSLPGMEPGKMAKVTAQEWRWGPANVPFELWNIKGPLKDWSVWDEWGGDKHCVWHRIYPSDQWGFAEFLLSKQVPEEKRWHFHSPPFVADSTAEVKAWEDWQEEAKRSSPVADEPGKRPRTEDSTTS